MDTTSITSIFTPQLITSIIVILVIVNLALGCAAYFILLERKVSAWVQDRIGPNRVGPKGLLQPIADGLKLFVKEDFIPANVDRAMFIIAPGLAIIPAIVAIAVIPWAGTLDLTSLGLQGTVNIVAADVNIGVIFLVATGSIAVYGLVLGGWASNNKYSFLGGLRVTAQMISYEIPMGVALLCVLLIAGSVRPDEIIAGQVNGQWFIIQQPLVAILFFTCMLAEANRAPFDLAEAEQELVGGWHTEYSSMKWALFFMGEYIHMFVGSAFFAILFLGGWSLNPFTGADLPAQGGIGLVLLQFAIIFAKVIALVFFSMAVRWTVPRFRFDQLLRLAWEGMIPVSLLLLLITSFFVYFGWQPYMWVGAIPALIVIYLIHPHMPRQVNVNHRVGIIGSRFSPLHDTDAALD